MTLYNYLEDSKSAAQVLNEAVDRLYNLDRTKGKYSRALGYLIRQNIIYQEKQGNGQRVTEMLEILHKYNLQLESLQNLCFSLVDFIQMIRILYRN